MIIKFKIFEQNKKEDIRYYKGYKIVKNFDKSPGEFGLWYVPDLYIREFGNKIKKGFETVSIIQSKEAIDKWFNFNLKIKEYKN